MKALFCTDGSDISFYALENIKAYCVDLELDILCVIDWHFYPMYMESPIKNYQNTYEEIADKILDFAELVIGHPNHHLNQFIKQHHIV